VSLGAAAVITEGDCRLLDEQDKELAAARAGFAPGAPGTIYLDANSIGPMPVDAPSRLAALLEQGWRLDRRMGWNNSDWLDQPRALGADLAHLIGADKRDVLVCDTTSVNQFKLLSHALAAAAPRRVIVVEEDVFPTNRYLPEGIAHAGAAELRLIRSEADLPAALSAGDVAVVSLSHVDYRSSRRLDIASLTRLIQSHGAMVLWDLSHSAGAVAIDLAGAKADYAVASGYKYLCGGPGAPALMYVHPSKQDTAWPAICGWMGHADTFGFKPGYQPAGDVARHLAGTPTVIANSAFGAAAALWRHVSVLSIDRRHRSLTDMLIALLDQECASLGLELVSPREHRLRGGHIAVRLTEPGANINALGQALLASGVVVSTRKPDALRFGVHPVATLHLELWVAVQRLREILKTGRWRDAVFNGETI
jgi:kynureninase